MKLNYRMHGDANSQLMNRSLHLQRILEHRVNYKCVSEDLYPILSHIENSQYCVKANSTLTEIFGNSNPQSYTLFLIFPSNGAGTFHVKLARVE